MSGYHFRPPVPSRLERAAAFALPGSLLLLYCLRNGSYDTVVRHEEALAVWTFLGLGFACGVLPRRPLPRGAGPVLGAALALAAWTALSLLWSETAEGALAEVARVAHLGALPLLVWALVGPATQRAAAGGVATVAVLVCALGVASRIAPGLFPADELRRVLFTERLNYPFAYWNAVAAWAAVALTMALAWSACAERAGARAAALAATPVCGLAIYLSYSRAGIAAVALGVLAALALGPRRPLLALHVLAATLGSGLAILVARGEPVVASGTGSGSAALVVAVLVVACALCAATAAATCAFGAERRQMSSYGARRLLASTAICAVLGAMVLGATGIASAAWEDFRDPQAGAVAATDVAAEARLSRLDSNRYDLWSAALDAAAEHPLSGLGAGSWEFWWSRNTPLSTYERNGHSIVFESVAELGLPGLALVIALLGGLLVAGLRARRDVHRCSAFVSAPLLAGFVVFLFFATVDWIWEMTAVTALGLICGALAVAPRATTSRLAARPVVLRAGVAVLAVLAICVQLPGLISTQEVRASQSAFRSGDLRGAAARAGAAVDAQPWAASPYVQRALVAEEAGDLIAARADIRRAIERESTNWRHRLLLSRIETRAGDRAAALRARAQARRLRPRSGFYVSEPG